MTGPGRRLPAVLRLVLGGLLVPLAAAACARPAPEGGGSPVVSPAPEHPSRLTQTVAARTGAAPTGAAPRGTVPPGTGPPRAALGDPAPGDLEPGLHRLANASPRGEVLVHVPQGLSADSPATLVLALHGAGGNAQSGLGPLLGEADAAGLLLVAPTSTQSTWDAVSGRWGADARVVDTALAEALARWPVRTDRLVVSGFSDGASYALGLGLANGDVVTDVVAFAPGFVPRGPRRGLPAVFLTHGTDDTVLPIDRTSRRIVPDLRDQGHAVEYREFPGGHGVPRELAAEAAQWLDRRER